jgi:hypothetical protein
VLASAEQPSSLPIISNRGSKQGRQVVRGCCACSHPTLLQSPWLCKGAGVCSACCCGTPGTQRSS